jgi:hypothetical protein
VLATRRHKLGEGDGGRRDRRQTPCQTWVAGLGAWTSNPAFLTSSAGPLARDHAAKLGRHARNVSAGLCAAHRVWRRPGAWVQAVARRGSGCIMRSRAPRVGAGAKNNSAVAIGV